MANTYMFKLNKYENMTYNINENGFMDYLLHPELVFVSSSPLSSYGEKISIHAYSIHKNDLDQIDFDESLFDECILYSDVSEGVENAVEVELPKVFLLSEVCDNTRNSSIPSLNFNHFGYKDENDYVRAADLIDLKPLAVVENRTTLEEAIAAIDANPEFHWSDERASQFNFYDGYLRDAIKHRYATAPLPTANRNLVMDSYLPRLLIDYRFNAPQIRNAMQSAAPKGQCISRAVADTMGLRQIPIDQLCAVLGYDKAAIKNLLSKVQEANKRLVLVGVGGTGMNAIYWLHELAQWINNHKIFREIHLFDKEEIELSNILRFPMNIESVTNTNTGAVPYKIELAKQFADTCSRNIYPNKTYLPKSRVCSAENILKFHNNLATLDDEGNPKFHDDVVVYGAPGLQARDVFSKMGNFIAGIHANSGCNLLLNPDMGDMNVQVESYGTIQLSAFFMNQLRMTLGLLETIANGTDLKQKDQTLLTYAFDGTRKEATDRAYQWNIIPEDTVRSEGLQ